MKALRIFISYSHDDASVATSLANLIQACFGPVLEETFVDRSAISLASNIKDSVSDALRRADILIAVILDAQPASVLSWPSFEIGTYLSYWDERIYKDGPHKDRLKGDLIGHAFALVNTEKVANLLGPLYGQRPINLGISESYLSVDDDPKRLNDAQTGASVANADLLTFLQKIEAQVRQEQQYVDFVENRSKSIPELVREFKVEVYGFLRNREKGRAKPTPQLIVRTKPGGSSLHPDTKLVSVANALGVFGLNNTAVFRKTDEGVPGSERQWTTWREFKDSISESSYAPYWCSVIEQAVVGATRAESGAYPMALISENARRYQVIATTITLFYNNEREVSLYLIETDRRPDHGDKETTVLLNLLLLIFRMRFAFMEKTSEFYWLNFKNKPLNPRKLLAEMDYIRAEAETANLEKPGQYEKFLNLADVQRMYESAQAVTKDLRSTCNLAIERSNSGAFPDDLVESSAQHLRKIDEDLKPYNKALGIAVLKKLLEIMESE